MKDKQKQMNNGMKAEKPIEPDLTIADATLLLNRLQANINQVTVINEDTLRLIVVAIIAQGHILLEDAPGVGKTLVAKALAGSISASFNRVQCTPDLLPSDVTGTSIYNQQEQRFIFVPGPLFAQIVLVDEINRATPRTQSSLLESMAEHQVTVDGQRHALEAPFFVIATQNPIEMSGTFPLPEAQLDRFLITLSLGYPEFEDEVLILEREEHGNPLADLEPVLSPQDVLALQSLVRRVDVVRSLKEYIVKILQSTRTHPDILLGASPRSGVALQRAAQAMALLNQRDYVTPDDIKAVIPATLGHRLITQSITADDLPQLMADLLRTIPVPLG
ncbi:MAG: MoxR family ATPase [Chloroflexota bacterium]